MAELKGKKRKQPSSCPEGWAPGAVVVQLELTRRQEHYARRCVGISRFVYNRLVANDQAGRGTGLWLTPHELEKEFNAAKQGNRYLAFITEVSKFVAQGACRNYRNARSRWLNKELQARRPVFHKKNRTGAGSFLAASGVNRIRYDGHRRIRLPYLGSVRMTRKLPDGIPYEVSVKRQNGRWYAGVAYWKTPALPPQRETQSVGGVDVGISPLAVDSGGDHPNPKAHYQPVRTANGQWRYPNPRGYAKALADAGMSGLLHQVRYKAQWYGTQIVEAGQWFPSSKTCSVCGAVNGDLQREPDWDCPECGSHHDRNENAARNLLKLALLAVGEDVMLPDGKALADGDSVIGETGPEEGRTKQAMTVAPQLTLAA